MEGEHEVQRQFPLQKQLDVPYNKEDPMFQPKIPRPVLKADSQFPVWTRYAETCAWRPSSCSSDLKLELGPGHPFQEFPDGFLHEA